MKNQNLKLHLKRGIAVVLCIGLVMTQGSIYAAAEVKGIDSSAITTTKEGGEKDKPASKAPQITEAKKMSLEDAIKIMKAEGTAAETAKLHKDSDIAVGNGYSEKVQRIKKTQDDLDNLDKLAGTPQGQAYLQMKGINPVHMAYEAQEKGVSSNNKEIMRLRRDFARENTENNYQAELNEIEVQTLDLYYKVLLAQENLKISKENLTAQQQNLKKVELKKAAGLLPKKDVLQAKSAVSEAKMNLREAETKLKYARMSFNYLMGFNVRQDVVFTSDIAGVIEHAQPKKADEAVEMAIKNRLELKGAGLAVKIYEILLKDVSNYPKNSSKYLGAKIDLAEAQKTEKEAYSKLEIDIRNRFNQVEEKREAVEAAKELLTYAQEGERLMKLTYEEGLSTVDELLDTQVKLYKAKLNLAKANSDYAVELKAYEYAQGIGVSRLPL